MENELNQQKSNLLSAIVLTVIITAAIAGGGVYLWQKSQSANQTANEANAILEEKNKKLEEQLLVLQKQIEDLQKAQAQTQTQTQLQPQTKPSDETNQDEYAGWKTYQNKQMGYSVKYPSDVKVAAGAEEVNFTGPLKDNERWPMITIAHYNSAAYNPPTGTDVEIWVKNVIKPAYNAIGAEYKIAGLKTFHVVKNRSPQSYAADIFYFIKGNKLFEIRIIHSKDMQDWGIYNKFLNSFSF